MQQHCKSSRHERLADSLVSFISNKLLSEKANGEFDLNSLTALSTHDNLATGLQTRLSTAMRSVSTTV
eukprot:4154389-Amphidinium_carterae.1